MTKRGRKSTAELSIAPISIEGRRPSPPADLTAPQAKTWRAIVSSTPAGWFNVTQEPLLAAYCRHVAESDRLSVMIDNCKPDLGGKDGLRRLDKLLAMRARETMAISSLATRMRLTQQAQMHPRSAGRAMDGAKLWDRTPPWEA
jgi:hypothetical protein